MSWLKLLLWTIGLVIGIVVVHLYETNGFLALSAISIIIIGLSPRYKRQYDRITREHSRYDRGEKTIWTYPEEVQKQLREDDEKVKAIWTPFGKRMVEAAVLAAAISCVSLSIQWYGWNPLAVLGGLVGSAVWSAVVYLAGMLAHPRWPF